MAELCSYSSVLLKADFFSINFYWRIADLQCCVRFCYRESKSVIHSHGSILI